MSYTTWNTDFTEVLADRLRNLREEKDLSWDRLAEALKDQYGIQIHRDTLKFYEAKGNHSKAGNNRAMKAEYLNCLADFYGVSVDYLLGRTDTRSPDADVQGIMQKTSLSETTVKELLGANFYGRQDLSSLVDDIAGIYLNILPDYLILTSTSKNYSPYSAKMEGLSLEEWYLGYCAVSEELNKHGEIGITKKEYMRYITAEIGNKITEGLRKKYIPGYGEEV